MHKHVKILPRFSKSLRKHSLSSFFLDNVEEKECVRERLKALFKKRSKTKNLLRALSSTFIVLDNVEEKKSAREGLKALFFSSSSALL